MKSALVFARRFGPVLLVLLALAGTPLLLPVSAAGAGAAASDAMQPSQPAQLGAGRMPQAFASNVGNEAWVYTSDIRTSMPTKTTGTIQISALDVSPADIASSGDRASITATLVHPTDGSNYTMRFTCVTPVGETYTHYGGVGINRPVFGAAMDIARLNLPQTMAYIAVFGNSTITKNGQTVASNQPAMAFVTQALHDADHAWLSIPDPARQEIQLIIPGSLQPGGTAVPGSPSGFVYVYWPNAAYELRNVGGAINVQGMAVTTTAPATQVKGTVQQVGAMPLRITLTNTGIRKSLSESDAGLYNVTVTNNSSRARGIEMSGMDLCCTEYHRFTNILRPGQSQSFRWYFAPGKVTVRGFTGARKTTGGYSNVRYGPYTSSITFK